MFIIASGSFAKMFNVRTAQLLKLLVGHSGIIRCLCISESEDALFTGAEDKTVMKWDLTTGELLSVFAVHASSISCLCTSEKVGALFTGSRDKTIKKWDLKTGDLLVTLSGLTDDPRCVGPTRFTLAENEGALFTGFHGGSVKKWDLKTCELLASMPGHAGWVTCLGISEKEGALFAGYCNSSEIKNVEKWDLKTGKSLASFMDLADFRFGLGILCLAISEKEGALFTGFHDGTIKKWDLKRGKVLANLTGHAVGINCLCIFEEKDLLFTGDRHNTVKIWKCTTCELLSEWTGSPGSVVSLGISEKESALLVGIQPLVGTSFEGFQNIFVERRDLKTGKMLAPTAGHNDKIPCLGISEKEGALFAGSHDKTVKKMDLSTGEMLATLTGHSGGVTGLCISEKEDALFTCSHDVTIRKWHLKTCELLATWKVTDGMSEGFLSCLCIFERENALFAGSWDKKVYKMDLKTGELLAVLTRQSDWIECLCISVKENALFLGQKSSKDVQKLDADTGEVLASLTGHSARISCLCISDKEDALFSGSDDKTVKKWDLETHELLATLTGHCGEITCLGISERRGTLITGSADQTVKIWSASSSHLLFTQGVQSHSAKTLAVCCSKSGMLYLASTAICALNLRSLMEYGVVVSTILPEPGFSLEKRYLPWALLVLSVATKICFAGQLAHCAFSLKAAMPARWIPPTEALEKFADLGIHIDDILNFDEVYFSVVALVLSFLSLLFVAGPLLQYMFFNPDSAIAKYSHLGLGFAFKFFCGACFLPLLKILLWPLAAWEEKGLTILIGVVAACLYTSATVRLTLLDMDLNRLRVKRNILDWSGDRRTHEPGQRKLSRQQVHVLSAKSCHYDTALLVLRFLSLLNSSFCTRVPDGGTTAAALQLILGVLIFAAGCFYEPYFPFVQETGGWDYNRLQNGMDAGLVAIYFAALLATFAAHDSTDKLLNSMWITFSPLLALPAAYAGYAAQAWITDRKRARRSVELDLTTPLMRSEPHTFLSPEPATSMNFNSGGYPSNDALRRGMKVRLQGLQSAAGAQLNGTLGHCEDFDSQTGRWGVRLSDGTAKAVKPENLAAVVVDGMKSYDKHNQAPYPP